jgi:hypothetical protein
MAEFDTGGHSYRTEKMSARDQLHLLRGLGPLFGPMVQLAMIDRSDQSMATQQLAFMVPFFEAFAKMEEHEVNVLLNKCLAVTRRREGSNGSSAYGPPLWNPSAGREQYSDIDLGSLMTIAWEVIQENLGGFFAIGSGPLIGTTPAADQPASPG